MRARLCLATLCPLFCCILPLALSTPTLAQFDLSDYVEHLASIQDLAAQQLLDDAAPYGPYSYSIPAPPDRPEYLDELIELYGLTSDELDLLGRHGFMVSERLARESYGAAIREIWHADMPLYISTDMILHALHRSYVEILATLEESALIPALDAGLTALHEGWPSLNAAYSGAQELREPLDDLDIYLAVARSLLAGTGLGTAGGNDAAVQTIVQDCLDEQPRPLSLFNETPRLYDYSQMKPRGHYTRSEPMKRYFRAMMWLGRTEMRLTVPPGIGAPSSVDREIIAASLLRELTGATGARTHLDEIDRVVKLMVGDPDNLTLDAMERIWNDLGLGGVDELLVDENMDSFDALLASGDFHPQAINSQILFSSPAHPEDLDPPYAFLLLGQRFVLDSYVFGNVVYDNIVFDGHEVFRGLPHPFDVLYCLGNDDVLPLLEPELEQYKYAANLSALRYLIDGYAPEYWGQNLYTAWLAAIRSLAHSGRQEGAPPYMQTGAFQQEKMNTQLASWAELRHDTLLYAKQSYTGGIVCSYPRVYVEPIPAFYAALGDFAEIAMAGFDGLAGGTLSDFFGIWLDAMARLEIVATKELAGQPLNEEEISFILSVLCEDSVCGPIETGWLRDLYFSIEDEPVAQPDMIIADVHTQPTDAAGSMVGRVLHVATGPPDVGIFIVAPPGQPLTAFAGPVASYREYVSQNFQRMTDEEWAEWYELTAPPARDWTHVYLADADGLARDTGPRLVEEGGLGVEDPPEEGRPPRAPIVELGSAPNPFNPRTVIHFRLEVEGKVAALLDIHDGRGRLIRRLYRAHAGTTTHYVSWDGRDDGGRPVASGIYHVRLRAAGSEATHKLTLLR